MARGIQIPEGEDRRLQRIAQWNDSFFESLLAAVDRAHPALYPSTFAKRVLISADQSHDSEDVEAVKSVLGIANLMLSRYETLDDTVSSLIDAIRRDKVLGDDRLLTLQKRLEALLSSPKITLVAQAFGTIVEDDNVLYRSTVTSSFRPVQSNLEDRTRIMGLALVHELSLTVSSSSGQRSFKCTLDSDDLIDLRDDIEHALETAQSMIQFTNRVQLPIVDEFQNDDEAMTP